MERHEIFRTLGKNEIEINVNLIAVIRLLIGDTFTRNGRKYKKKYKALISKIIKCVVSTN